MPITPKTGSLFHADSHHKLDDEKSLWTVDVIGVSEPREDRPKK